MGGGGDDTDTDPHSHPHYHHQQHLSKQKQTPKPNVKVPPSTSPPRGTGKRKRQRQQKQKASRKQQSAQVNVDHETPPPPDDPDVPLLEGVLVDDHNGQQVMVLVDKQNGRVYSTDQPLLSDGSRPQVGEWNHGQIHLWEPPSAKGGDDRATHASPPHPGKYYGVHSGLIVPALATHRRCSVVGQWS